MKRIVEINIFNFKAYFYPTTIKLDKGENLLIYGENGSGKPSFRQMFIQDQRTVLLNCSLRMLMY